MGSDVVTISVSVTEYPGTPGETKKWLAPNRAWTQDEAEALLLRARRSVRMGARPRVEQRCHELAGGLRAWLDMTVSEQDIWSNRLLAYSAAIWPDGRPKVESPAQEREQEALLQKAWEADRSDLATGLVHLRHTIQQIRFLATWPDIVVDAPRGWEDLRELPDDPPGLLDMLVRAYNAAVDASEATAGN